VVIVTLGLCRCYWTGATPIAVGTADTATVCFVVRGESPGCRLFGTASMLEWLRNPPPPPLTGDQYRKMEPKHPEVGH